jgi:hypothetical protein
MAKLKDLSTELFQQIASFLSLSEKYKLLGTSKAALRGFYDDQHEGRGIWDPIIDPVWLELRKSEGFEIYLVGDLGKFRNPNPEDQDLVVALFMSGRDPYKEVRPEGYPRSIKEIRQFNLEKPDIAKKFRADIDRVKKERREELLSALRSSDLKEERHEVVFPKFSVHVGSVFGERGFVGLKSLLQTDEKHTLLLQYGGGPLPMQKVAAKCSRGKLNIEKDGKELAWFFDMD